MIFANLRMLWLAAIALPLLALFFWWSWRKRQQLTKQFIHSRLLAQLTVGVSKSVFKWRMLLLGLAVALVFLALARPLWGMAAEEVRQRGLDIVVAIDTSRSMLAEDVAPNRLERAKLAALDLMKLARHDRLGLVAFAGTAFLQCPLTLDDEAFRQSVSALQAGIIPQGGTALAEAISAALGAFKEEGDNFKVLVLFTDGEDHEEGVEGAVEKAVEAEMHIFTIGVGSANGELLRVEDEKGQSSYLKDEKGNVVKSRLNEQLLTEMATKTDGFYLGLSGANTMDVLYRQGLAPLPRTETATRMIRQHKEQFMWPLALAVLILVLEVFLPERKRVARAESLSIAPASESLRKAVAAGVLVLFAASASASPGRALRQYEAGRFAESMREFERLAEKKPQDARLHYNAGAAAFRAKQFDEAQKHFQSALNPDNLPLQQSAYYNLGNTRYRLGEQQDEPAQKIESWEQAVKDYESALKLNPQDRDAQFNLDLVRTKLEELKKQQQENQKQNKDQQNNKDDQDKKDQQNQQKDQPKDKQQNPQQEKKDQEQKKQDEQNKQQPQKPDQDKQDKDQQQSQKQDPSKEGQQKDQPQPRGQEPEKKDQPQPGQGAAAQPGQMTKEQVEKLLDAQKGEEKALIFQPADKARSRTRIFKDW